MNAVIRLWTRGDAAQGGKRRRWWPCVRAWARTRPTPLSATCWPAIPLHPNKSNRFHIGFFIVSLPTILHFGSLGCCSVEGTTGNRGYEWHAVPPPCATRPTPCRAPPIQVTVDPSAAITLILPGFTGQQLHGHTNGTVNDFTVNSDNRNITRHDTTRWSRRMFTRELCGPLNTFQPSRDPSTGWHRRRR